MTGDPTIQRADLARRRQQATEIVTAYVRRNPMPRDALPVLIRDVLAALALEPVPTAPAKRCGRCAPRVLRPPTAPAVPIAESVSADWIVSLETGQRLKTLERHLRAHGLTPGEYRARWGLPADYPISAPAFAARRSAFGRELGAGRVPRLGEQ